MSRCQDVKNWSKSVCFWELKNKISNDKLCNKVFNTLFSWNFGSSRWIFLKMENAYSLVCNMWKVHTRPTSASDFFFRKFLNEFRKIPNLSMHFYVLTSKAGYCKISDLYSFCLDTFLPFFQVIFKNFQENSFATLKYSKSEYIFSWVK
jgi:hypothetical protein